jgi:hypothetical protein
MTMPPGQTTITVINAPLVVDERHGRQSRNWDSASEVDLPGCWVQPIGGSEAVLDREFSATHLRLFTTGTDALQATSRVRIDGVTYEMDGPPQDWPGPSGERHHTEATLKRLTG